MAGGFDGIRDLASAEVYDPRWGSSFSLGVFFLSFFFFAEEKYGDNKKNAI